jgi:type I restriction enzyme S subunit
VTNAAPHAEVLARTEKWLGELPHDWRGARLSELAAVWTSNVDKLLVDKQEPVRLCNYTDVYKNDRITGDMDFMVASATKEQVRRFRIRRGDTIITKDSETADDIGVPAFVDYEADDLVCGYHLAIVRPDTECVDPRFLYWVLESAPVRRQWSLLAAGVTRVGLRNSDLSKVTVPVPHGPQQAAIAQFLDRETVQIDTLIAQQQRLVGLASERRSAVLNSLFSPSDETEMTRVGRRLSCRPTYGVLVPDYVSSEDGVPLVRVSDLQRMGQGTPPVAISKKQSAEYSRTRLRGGEVLLGVVGKMGQAAVAPAALADANVARAVAVLRCADADDAPVLRTWFSTEHFLHQALSATSGDTVQPTLGMADLSRFEIHWPRSDWRVELADKQITRIDALIEQTHEHIGLAKERRAALITAAVTGQIDVPRKVN